MQQVRAFLSPDNPLGFGAADSIELVAALLLAVFFLLRSGRREQFEKFAAKTGWCMLFLGALPIVLRLALLARYPVPVPTGSDDFGHLLLADTLRHFRLANPPHALPQFFQQIFVLQEPTHSSIYPLGQGSVLALGWILFGHPWAGVLLSTGALCALVYWMLRAWAPPVWALAGGLLAVAQFGPLSYWMNCYWGGAVSACAGCLVCGALPRRNALLLGAGLSLQLLTRPYEFLFLLIAVLLFVALEWKNWRKFAAALLLVAAAAGLTLLQNKAVTGQWSTIPYQVYRYRYGVPPTFTWQANAVPHGPLNSEQQLDYETETAVHGPGLDTLPAYWDRLLFRARFYRFFLPAALYPALFGCILLLRRQPRLAWAVATILLFSLGTNFFPFFFPHYIAAVGCLFLLIAVAGLQRLNQVGTLLLFFCAAHFTFWYGIHAVGSKKMLYALTPYESWDYINQGDSQGRIAIAQQLARQNGQQLVFVRYSPQHRFQEWINNAADIDGSPVVWAHDLGPEENIKLRRYYPNRKAWLLEPDAQPPKLTLFPVEKTQLFQDVP